MLVHERLTRQILSCAYRVHSRLGPGLLERVYAECLCYELQRSALTVEGEKLLPVRYDDLVLQIGYRLDIVVEDAVVVEIKAIERTLSVHVAQLVSYPPNLA